MELTDIVFKTDTDKRCTIFFLKLYSKVYIWLRIEVSIMTGIPWDTKNYASGNFFLS